MFDWSAKLDKLENVFNVQKRPCRPFTKQIIRNVSVNGYASYLGRRGYHPQNKLEINYSSRIHLTVMYCTRASLLQDGSLFGPVCLYETDLSVTYIDRTACFTFVIK